MPDALALAGPTGLTAGFLLLQHFSYFLLSSPHRCFISVFVWFLYSQRCCTDELESLHADRTSVLCIPRQTKVRGLRPRKIDLSPPIIFLLTIQRRCFCCGLLFLSLYVLACMSWYFCFILDCLLGNFWERNYHFGFFLVVFWLWCRFFKCALLSPWCLGQKVLGNGIDSWLLPSFLFTHWDKLDFSSNNRRL